ncbi:Pepco domain-containing protein [Streptomyces sp. G35A]
MSLPQPTTPTASENPGPQPTGTISVFGLEDTDQGRTDRLSFRRLEEWRAARTDIPAEVLQTRLHDFVATMRGVLASLPQQAGEFRLDEVSFSAEVSAKGTVSLLGSGGELSGQAGITFTFTRRAEPASQDPAPAQTGTGPREPRQ